MLLAIVPFSSRPNVCFSQQENYNVKFLHRPLFPFLP
jgi:hypothetical protein